MMGTIALATLFLQMLPVLRYRIRLHYRAATLDDLCLVLKAPKLDEVFDAPFLGLPVLSLDASSVTPFAVLRDKTAMKQTSRFTRTLFKPSFRTGSSVSRLGWVRRFQLQSIPALKWKFTFTPEPETIWVCSVGLKSQKLKKVLLAEAQEIHEASSKGNLTIKQKERLGFPRTMALKQNIPVVKLNFKIKASALYVFCYYGIDLIDRLSEWSFPLLPSSIAIMSNL